MIPRPERALPWLPKGFWLAQVLACIACGDGHDTVFYPLSVEFETEAAASAEGSQNVGIALRLNAASEEPVDVTYRVSDVSASGHDACGTRDYTLGSGSFRFEPGQTEGVLSLRLLDDDVHELDEVLRVELVSVTGALLGDKVLHVHTILDDDRELLLNVRDDFGARGDASTDDTQAIQAAVDRASLSAAAVVYWPPGQYLVTSLELPVGVNYFGYGATLLQAASRANDAELVRFSYSGDDDSTLTLVQGLTLDGNRDAQGAFAAWQFQESELLHVEADRMRAGRVRLFVEDVTLANTGGSGIWLGQNTDAALCQIEGQEVFTDVVKLAGGYSRLGVDGLEGDGSVGTSGVAITGQLPGFGDSHTVEVSLERITLFTGDLEIDVQDASSVIASNVAMSEPPFYLRALRSSVTISDSLLMVGPSRYRYNRIVAPHAVTFVNTELRLSELVERSLPEPEADRELTLLPVTWDDVDYAFDAAESDELLESLSGQRLALDGCRFQLAGDVEASDVTFVAGSVGNVDASNNLVVSRSSLGSGFSALFAPSCAVCSEIP